jgi:hypothetical protein
MKFKNYKINMFLYKYKYKYSRYLYLVIIILLYILIIYNNVDVLICQPPIGDTPFSTNSVEFTGYYGDPVNNGPSFLLERDGTLVKDNVLYGNELSDNASYRTSDISSIDSHTPGIPSYKDTPDISSHQSADALSLDKWSTKNHVSNDASSYKTNNSYVFGEMTSNQPSNSTMIGEIPRSSPHPSHDASTVWNQKVSSGRVKVLKELGIQRERVNNIYGDMQLHRPDLDNIKEHVVSNSNTTGTVKVGFSYKLSSLHEVYVKYDNIARRRFFWKIWEKHTDTYGSYDDFKKNGWDPNTDITKTLNANIIERINKLLELKAPFQDKSLQGHTTKLILKSYKNK